MPVPAPTPGSYVHFAGNADTTDCPDECQIALVIKAGPSLGDVVQWAVIKPDGAMFGWSTYDDTRAGGTWHWPERT